MRWRWPTRCRLLISKELVGSADWETLSSQERRDSMNAGAKWDRELPPGRSLRDLRSAGRHDFVYRHLPLRRKVVPRAGARGSQALRETLSTAAAASRRLRLLSSSASATERCPFIKGFPLFCESQKLIIQVMKSNPAWRCARCPAGEENLTFKSAMSSSLVAPMELHHEPRSGDRDWLRRQPWPCLPAYAGWQSGLHRFR